MNYGVYFKKARLDSGYSQKEVANKLHIHQSNVSDWENDVSRPEYEKLVALAKLYDVSLYDLLGVPDEERF
ncbi:MAG: helix-turn-helix transcriptional regulator [Clostridia bacterium]|nr:helix-turn-helix transcriptional regulator [Clostridia bacterium]MDY2713884.1 helix-turn-helix transcriptional regulator [Christensenellaceae bacterium]MDY3724065.1 helix-turn-helix transcriptional regulator [Christensenellaceae bacterium]